MKKKLVTEWSKVEETEESTTKAGAIFDIIKEEAEIKAAKEASAASGPAGGSDIVGVHRPVIHRPVIRRNVARLSKRGALKTLTDAQWQVDVDTDFSIEDCREVIKALNKKKKVIDDSEKVEFKVGDLVTAAETASDHWYGGRVTKVHEGPLYDVEFYDNEVEKKLDPDSVDNFYQVGDDAMALYEGEWFPVIVLQIIFPAEVSSPLSEAVFIVRFDSDGVAIALEHEDVRLI